MKSEDDELTDSRRIWRVFIYVSLTVASLMFLAPVYVMIVTSLKTLAEVQSGNMMSLPENLTFQPWIDAWETACIGLTCKGINGFFINSIKMTVPAVIIATIVGAFNGYILTKWRFKGDTIIFALMLFGCFIPFQVVLLPTASVLGFLGIANSTAGLVLVHVAYGIGFSTLFFRNYYMLFPTSLVHAAMIDGAGFFQIFFKILLPSSAPILIVTVIWLSTNIWNDFLFGVSFSSGESAPMTVALNNLVNSSHGVKEYNVHMAAAIIAAVPTLGVYILAGKYFVRGLMAGSIKG